LLASLQKEVKKEKPENPEKDASKEDSTEGKADEVRSPENSPDGEATASEGATGSEDEKEGPSLEAGTEDSNSNSNRQKQVTGTEDSNIPASNQRIPKKTQGKKDKKAKKDEKDKKAKKDSTRNTGAPPLQCLPLAVHQLFYNAYVHESMCACKPVCRAGGRGISDTGLFKTCEKGQPKKRKQQTARITTGPCTGPRLALPSNDIDIDINDIDFND
jgi:hypothetical protein